MLSYQHIYHAGNFADVHKHALLARTLRALRKGAGRIFALDTHAGAGLYDLSSPEARKKREFMNGAAALWEQAGAPLSDWAGLLRKYNRDGALETYPGSARMLADILHPTDRIVLCELHPGAFSALQKNHGGGRNVEALRQDGLAALQNLLPPPERRGIAVIDPPYEIKTDYGEMPRRIRNAHAAWPRGVFFLWYPILTQEPHRAMLADLRRAGIPGVLVSELRMEDMPGEGFAMYGSGVAIINPPLREPAAREITDHIAASLPAPARSEVFWLDNKAIDGRTGLLASP